MYSIICVLIVLISSFVITFCSHPAVPETSTTQNSELQEVEFMIVVMYILRLSIRTCTLNLYCKSWLTVVYPLNLNTEPNVVNKKSGN